MSKKRWLKYCTLTVIVAILTFVVWAGTELLGTSLPIRARPFNHSLTNYLGKSKIVAGSEYIFKMAQRQIRPTDVWPFVYQTIPDLPLENHYVSQETGEIDTENTLVSRLIRYHLYVKGRPPNYRFDWKLTLADYLGINDYLQSSVYPGNDSLKENPMDGDREAIKTLARSQREALVNRLVDIFGGDPNPPSIPEIELRNNPGRSTPKVPIIPQPGDADLLKF